jgi:hypothetical protein
MRKLWKMVAGAMLAVAASSAPAFADERGDGSSAWAATYDVAPLEDVAPRQGWAFRAELVSDWGSPMGLVTVSIPAQLDDDPLLEFSLPVEADRPRKRFESWIDNDVRFRLLGELVTLLASPETDRSEDEGAPICIHVWGAMTQFAVDGEIARELSADACYRNKELFYFAISAIDATHEALDHCRDMVSDQSNTIYRLWECSLLTGDVSLVRRYFQPLEDIHEDWPDRQFTDVAQVVDWQREGGFAEQDVFSELVSVSPRAYRGTPQGEIEISATYLEDLNDNTFSWDAREVWVIEDTGQLRLLSLTVTNPQLVPQDED